MATVKAGLPRARSAGAAASRGMPTGTIVVNSSRAILYASAKSDFATAARQAALATRDELNAARRG